MSASTHIKIIVAIFVFAVLVILFLPYNSETNQNVSYLWNKNWNYIDYYENDLENPKVRFICEKGLFKDKFYVETPSLYYLKSLENSTNKSSTISEINSTPDTPKIESITDLKKKGEPKFERYQATTLVNNICNDFEKVSIKAYYNKDVLNSLETQTKDYNSKEETTVQINTLNQKTQINSNSIGRIREIGLENPKSKLVFYNYRMFPFLKGETMLLGKKFENSGNIFVKVESSPNFILILSDYIFNKLSNTILDYRKKEVALFPNESYIYKVKIKFDKTVWKSIAHSNLSENKELKDSKVPFIQTWKTVSELKHLDYTITQKQYKKNVLPPEWYLNSNKFNKEKFDANIATSLDNNIKQLSLDYFSDDLNFRNFGDINEIWTNSSALFLEMKLDIAKGANYFIQIKKPKKEIIKDNVKYLLIKSTLSYFKIQYIREDKVNALIDSAIAIEKNIENIKQREEQIKKAQNKQIRELKLRENLSHKTLSNLNNPFTNPANNKLNLPKDNLQKNNLKKGNLISP